MRGKGDQCDVMAILSRDHPRVCGEKRSAARAVQAEAGSPPRMRGKGCAGCLVHASLGITPAYAGKRITGEVLMVVMPDHPRVCGEKTIAVQSSNSHQGSPPRMRGKEEVKALLHFNGGITPAYAGKRLKRSHSIGHFSCILCLFHSVLHRASASGGSRAGPCAPPCLPAQNTVPV